MKYLTGAFAGVLMVAGLAMSSPALAVQDCKGCIAQYDKCIAAGGSWVTCWTCNNPTCAAEASHDPLGATLGKLSNDNSKRMNLASKRPTTALVHS